MKKTILSFILCLATVGLFAAIQTGPPTTSGGSSGGGTNSLGLANSVFVSKSGSDSTGVRGSTNAFLTLTAAKSAAQAGDTIFVYPGVYTGDQNLAFNGTWMFQGPSCVVSNFANDALGTTNALFQDSATITNISVLGRPTLIYHTGTNVYTWVNQGNDVPSIISANINRNGVVLCITNPATVCSFEVDSTLLYTYAKSIGPTAIGVINCSNSFVDTRTIFDSLKGSNFVYVSSTIGPLNFHSDNTVGMYWQLGECNFEFDRIYPFSGYAIWANEPAGSHTNNFYVHGHEINQKMYQSAFSPTYRSWFTIDWINCSNSTASFAFDVFGGFSYLRAQKVSEAVGGAIQVVAGGVLWADVQKVSSPQRWFHSDVTTSNQAFLRVQQYEDLGGMTNGILLDGGMTTIEGGVGTVLNGVGLGIAGGTNTIKNLSLDTSLGSTTNTWPLLIQGGSNFISGCSFISASGTYAAFASSAKTIYGLGGSFFSSAIAPNLTLGGGSTIANVTANNITATSSIVSTLTATNTVTSSNFVQSANATNGNIVFVGASGALYNSNAVPTAALGTGTANSTKYLRGDKTWQVTPVTVTVTADSTGFHQDGASANFASGSVSAQVGDLSNQSAYTVFGNSTGVSATPTFNTVPVSLGHSTLRTNLFAIAATGWTNTNSFNCVAMVSATAATVTYSDGTNTIRTFTGITQELQLPMHPSYKFTASSGLAGNAIAQ